MRISYLALTSVFLALVSAAGCDQAPPDEVQESARLDDLAVAEAALEALDSEEAHRPEFWLTGLKAGSVDLGSWSCTPPPTYPTNCTKLNSGWVCPMPLPEEP